MLTAGLLTMIEGVALVVWGSQPYAMPPFSGEAPLVFGPIRVPTQAFWVFGVDRAFASPRCGCWSQRQSSARDCAPAPKIPRPRV